jgi:diacylglycerol kinase family enzyme
MRDDTRTETTIEGRHRLLAVLALVSAAATAVVAALAVSGAVLRIAAGIALVLGLVLAGWYALTRSGRRRYVGAAVAAGLAVAVVALVLTGESRGLLLVVLAVLVAASSASARAALGHLGPHAHTHGLAGARVGPAARPVLIMNLRSGGGKAERFGLEDECRRRGIEPVVLRPGDDLRQLAVDAVAGGADVIGMAGGDGSQALVASVAAEHDVAHVCIPAGTRNHFALDLGLDRDDVVGALDAFAEGIERRIDLATVNGRVFVNNVSLGVYAEVVQSDEYRDAKRQTTMARLPELLGPEAAPFDLHYDGPDGTRRDGDQIIQVSNNPYVLTSLSGFGTRERLDTGELGVASVHVERDVDVARFVALEAAGHLSRFEGWTSWATPRFQVDSSAPVAAGVDGEALRLDPPLVFEAWPSAVRVRIPVHAPGTSPAARVPHLGVVGTVRALAATAAGRTA